MYRQVWRHIKIRRNRGILKLYRGNLMKNAYKLLAVVAVAALLTANAAPSEAAHAKSHKASQHKMCKKDRDGKCLSFFGALGRNDESWKGTRKAWQNVQHD
jgi:hypothetical protein